MVVLLHKVGGLVGLPISAEVNRVSQHCVGAATVVATRQEVVATGGGGLVVHAHRFGLPPTPMRTPLTKKHGMSIS